jgi:hypothetical protein
MRFTLRHPDRRRLVVTRSGNSSQAANRAAIALTVYPDDEAALRGAAQHLEGALAEGYRITSGSKHLPEFGGGVAVTVGGEYTSVGGARYRVEEIHRGHKVTVTAFGLSGRPAAPPYKLPCHFLISPWRA